MTSPDLTTGCAAEAMSEEEIAAARALCDAATPGPWDTDTAPFIVTNRDYDVANAESPVDATFIAVARTLVPRLLVEVARLKSDLRCEQIRAEDRGASFAEAIKELDEQRELAERFRSEATTLAEAIEPLEAENLDLQRRLVEAGEREREASSRILADEERLKLKGDLAMAEQDTAEAIATFVEAEAEADADAGDQIGSSLKRGIARRIRAKWKSRQALSEAVSTEGR
jgi:hypothetical protein